MNTSDTGATERCAAPEPESTQNASFLSEAAFLQQRIDETTVAIRHTVDELTACVPGAVDVASWAKRYPWAAVGAAVATGFFAAKIIAPAKRPVAATVQYVLPPNAQSAPPPQPPKHSSLFLPFVTALANAVAQGLLVSIVQPSATPAPSSNGKSEEAVGDCNDADMPS